jgi:hypothetical protein
MLSPPKTWDLGDFLLKAFVDWCSQEHDMGMAGVPRLLQLQHACRCSLTLGTWSPGLMTKSANFLSSSVTLIPDTEREREKHFTFTIRSLKISALPYSQQVVCTLANRIK